MRVFERAFLDELSAQAQSALRRRMNFNLHPTLDDPCQRLLNAIEPGSYVRPHRHLLQPKPELFVAVRGRMALFHFDDRGQVLNLALLIPGGESSVAEIESGAWHSLVALESGSVFLEVKPGPYRPVDQEDLAPWTPAEGTSEAVAYLAQLVALTGKLTIVADHEGKHA